MTNQLADMIISSIEMTISFAKTCQDETTLAIRLGRALAFASVYYYITEHKLKEDYPELEEEINELYRRVYRENS